MSIGISRRRWLESVVATTLCLSPAVAQPPIDRPPTDPLAADTGTGDALLADQAAVRTASKIPIASRTVRLRGIGKNSAEAIVVTAIAADPRSELLAVAGDDHAIRIMSASTLGVIRTVQGHRDVIRSLSFDADGSKLVSAGNDGQVILWDRENSFRVIQRTQSRPALACVCFSTSGSTLAAVGFDNDVYVIGLHGEQRTGFQCDSTDLRAAAYRGDDRVLAVGGRSGALQLFDTSNGQRVGNMKLHQGRIHGIAFHHDSRTAVCVGDDGQVSVVDTKEGKLLHRINVTTGKLYAVAVLDNRHVAVAGSDNVIRVVNTADGTINRRLEGHQGTVATLAASGGMLFSGGYDATLRRWSIGESTQDRQRIAEGDPRIDR